MDVLDVDGIPPNIRTFIEALERQALSLVATLNINFGFKDENVSVNMRGDENLSVDKLKSLGIPELTPKLIANAADPRRLCRSYIDEWEDFQRQMNFLFEDISSQQGKS